MMGLDGPALSPVTPYLCLLLAVLTAEHGVMPLTVYTSAEMPALCNAQIAPFALMLGYLDVRYFGALKKEKEERLCHL